MTIEGRVASAQTISGEVVRGGGGSGGSTVVVTPITTTGTHIADISVDGVNKELYAPSGSGGTATDVQINGTSITEDGVANIPNLLYLDENGNIRVKDAPTSTQWTGNVGIYTNGNITLSALSQSIINSRTSGTTQFLTGGLLDYAVKSAMCDGKGAAWTETEQQAAQQRLGILSAEGVGF